ncbi:hypothetical protein Trco_000003 [Trichoderma cornu-damae]|uniref:Uncharacterized protein n=1 Tax=Trichoderma cornu-damae TaxID=654480 RepID=A0A9P8TYV6_9HYPO|nr:hypothetical protein Trco_000003 [Trichoderma cornu-damae]
MIGKQKWAMVQMDGAITSCNFTLRTLKTLSSLLVIRAFVNHLAPLPEQRYTSARLRAFGLPFGFYLKNLSLGPMMVRLILQKHGMETTRITLVFIGGFTMSHKSIEL